MRLETVYRLSTGGEKGEETPGRGNENESPERDGKGKVQKQVEHCGRLKQKHELGVLQEPRQ